VRKTAPGWRSRLAGWPLQWRQARMLAAAAAVVVAVAVLSIGLRPSVGPEPSPSPTPSPTAPAGPTPSPERSPAATQPPATIPPPQAWFPGGILEIQLGPGWYDPPDTITLAVKGALDRLHDPDAGVYRILISKNTLLPGTGWLFRDRTVALTQTLYRTGGISASTAATELTAAEEANGHLVTRGSLTLPLGKAVQLDWDVAPPFEGASRLHHRAVLLAVGPDVVRIDLVTAGAPSAEVAAEFLGILRSATPVEAPAATP